MPAYTNPRPSGPPASSSGPISVNRRNDNRPKIDMSDGIQAGIERYGEESRTKDDEVAKREKPVWVDGPDGTPPTETR